ncbi:hypothetical protein WT09_00950 [Burkholderia stagnalis]|nr:hypothetical protein WT09_00950 [Burkholderia stagnalis]KVN64771.1 hypothetical protein WT14_12280 [Burkholderia stagnalis]KVO57217.1 hypothetical protein WT18_00290 [Burkholderia stagnalis]KVP08868.1 hypothetical protein WT20_21690 [Burkholderia stagnalis]KVW88492.1 hypothetical protein WT30_32310 [Burkholderia stagnalis]
MKRGRAMKPLSRLAIAALLAAAAAPAFARGMPQLPDDDGGRAGVLRALNPARTTDDARPQMARAGSTEAQARPCGTDARNRDASLQ